MLRKKRSDSGTFKTIDENDFGSITKENLSNVWRTICTYLSFSKKEFDQQRNKILKFLLKMSVYDYSDTGDMRNRSQILETYNSI